MNTHIFQDLIGKTVTHIAVNGAQDEIYFMFSDGEAWKMYHDQECCESVSIEEIVGDLFDLIGSPLLEAEGVDGETGHADWGTFTWTYYKFGTIKGHVNIRWYGSSNGYYSESVSFRKA